MDGRKGGDELFPLPGYASSSTDRSSRLLRRGLVVSGVVFPGLDRVFQRIASMLAGYDPSAARLSLQ